MLIFFNNCHPLIKMSKIHHELRYLFLKTYLMLANKITFPKRASFFLKLMLIFYAHCRLAHLWMISMYDSLSKVVSSTPELFKFFL